MLTSLWHSIILGFAFSFLKGTINSLHFSYDFFIFKFMYCDFFIIVKYLVKMLTFNLI